MILYVGKADCCWTLKIHRLKIHIVTNNKYSLLYSMYIVIILLKCHMHSELQLLILTINLLIILIDQE